MIPGGERTGFVDPFFDTFESAPSNSDPAIMLNRISAREIDHADAGVQRDPGTGL